MPLDPFFSERLRVHRRYLIGRWLKAIRARVTRIRIRRTAAPSQSPTRSSAATGGSPATKARARHRRAALAWDRTELETVGTPGPDVHTEDHVVAVPGRPAVTVRIHYPSTGARPVRPVPAWLTFYGGAFRIGGIDYPTTDAANRRRAMDAGVAVVAVAYSLAPEHRFPTQIEQAEAALRWVHANAADLGLDPERIGVMGTSAGGSIAAALTIVNRDRVGVPLRMQLLEVPVTDLTGRHIDLRATWALGVPSVIVLRELRSVARTYLRHRADARDPRASPFRAPSHAGLPPATILTAEYDPLRGDGAAYAARLRAAGVDATCVRVLGVTHDVPIFTGALPAARHWHRVVVATLASLRDDPPGPPQSRGERR